MQCLHGFGQREAVADKPFQLHLAAEHKSRCLLLQIHGSAVGTQETLFIDANGGGINRCLAVLSLRKQQYATARTGSIHGWTNQTVPCYRNYDCICPPAVRQLPDGLYGVGARGVDVLVQTERLTYCMPLGKQIGSYYPNSAAAGQHRQNDADGSLTNHEHRLAGRKSQCFNTFHAGIDRLDEGCLLERHTFRNADNALANDPFHHPNVLGETAAAGFVAGGRAHLLIGGTLGEHLVSAVIAVAARNVMENHHPVPNVKFRNIVPEGSYHPGSFMAEDARRGMRPSGNLLQVCAADATGVDPHQHLTRANRRNRYGLEPDVIDTTVHGRRHSQGDCLLPRGTAELCRDRHFSYQFSVASCQLNPFPTTAFD